MHLLTAQAGALQQEGEAIDLGQSPGEIVFVSAADSELSLLAGAVDRAGAKHLRLANLLRLSHHLSVDLWIEKTARHARLVVVRLLGGAAYWPYGVDQLTTLAASGRFSLALLPGEAIPDPLLEGRSTLSSHDLRRLHSLFTAGGPENADAVLRLFDELSLPSPLRGGVGGRMAHAVPTAPPPPSFPPLKGEGGPTAPFGNERHDRSRNVARARTLRTATTPPERIVWKMLRGFSRIHFRRQVPIGPYFADFACHHPKLIIELDGHSHEDEPAQRHDERRDAFLIGAGYRVLRFTNSDVATNLDGIWQAIDATLTELSLPSPLRGGAGGGGPAAPSLPTAPPPPSFPPLKGEGGPTEASVEDIRPFPRFGHWTPGRGVSIELAVSDRPAIPLLFYRAALEGAGTAVLEALCAGLERQGLAPVPLMISTLKEGACVRFVKAAFVAHRPQVILNLTGFALGVDGLEEKLNPFAGIDAPVIQLVQGGRPEAQWAADMQGLSSKDLAMQIVLPELDGRIGGIIVGHKADAVWHAATECPLSAYAIDADGIRRAVMLATNYVLLRATPRAERKVAIVLANYPIRDGRLANGVGYDAPESTARILDHLRLAGYQLAAPPSPALPARGRVPAGDLGTIAPLATSPLAGEDGRGRATGNDLIDLLQSGPTNAHPERAGGIPFPLARYRELFATLPEKVQREVLARWGDAADDPFVSRETFHLPGITWGNVTVLLQPARGYDRDMAAAYHDPDLVPPHAYLAAYLWLRHEFGAHALIHNGKHGSLEWLPGKAVTLDESSYPALLWGELPHLYPFIVNDPGEGTQAKRRTGATIIDHLVPPLTRAETYGPLKDLEALLDEYYAASGMDRRRLRDLRRRILDFTRDARLDRDIALPTDETEALKRIDTFLCDLKEAQIRDGLHVFGHSPTGRQERDLLLALARVPRGERPQDQSLIRALADDLKLGFDPLTVTLGEAWAGPDLDTSTPTPSPPLKGEGDDRTDPSVGPPSPLRGGNEGGGGAVGRARTTGDVVERLEELSAQLLDGTSLAPGSMSAAVLAEIEATMRPRLRASGPNERQALLDGLDGKFIAPGPSGAPSRGRLDVLPTGRNFYSVDNRAIPTPTAWELGRKSAETLLTRHFQDNGAHLRSLALSVWGTSNMRTGGDDIAQALAFIGARPTWDPSSLRLSGYEIIPLARLGRPRVDVTLRISGLFRDAFPQQIALFDRAARAIGALDEPEGENPISARMRSDALGLMKGGTSEADAALQAGHRIFGSKPGAYGAGLQALLDSGRWQTKADLGKAFLNWGQYAYGAHAAGVPELARFAARLGDVEAVVHNQDNREHDLLDSDDYYQFEGGLVATAEHLSGRRPLAYHNDHSRPERPVARTLEEEISKVMRSRVVNPKWIDGVKRHGYKGAFEIIATVDYMFAFAATTGAVKTHHFDLAFEAFVEDEATREFIRTNNRFGYDELLAKFGEARARGYWTPRSNSAFAFLEGAAA